MRGRWVELSLEVCEWPCRLVRYYTATGPASTLNWVRSDEKSDCDFSCLLPALQGRNARRTVVAHGNGKSINNRKRRPAEVEKSCIQHIHLLRTRISCTIKCGTGLQIRNNITRNGYDGGFCVAEGSYSGRGAVPDHSLLWNKERTLLSFLWIQESAGTLWTLSLKLVPLSLLHGGAGSSESSLVSWCDSWWGHSGKGGWS